MIVHLMYPDRDFDPKQALPKNSNELIQDLELGTIFDAMAKKDEFLYAVAKTAILSSLTNYDQIRYRNAVLHDCIKNPQIVRDLYQIPIEAGILKRKRWLGLFTHSPTGVLSSAVEMMSMFVDLLRKLNRIAIDHSEKFDSEGFKTFFEWIKTELDEEYIQTVEYHLKQLRFKNGNLFSAKLGKGNEIDELILRMPNRKNWFENIVSKVSPGYTFRIAERDDAGMRILGDLKNLGLNAVANALAQSADNVDIFLDTLRQELAFYIGCLNLLENLQASGNSYCFSSDEPADDFSHSTAGLYDVGLALVMKQKITGNELAAARKQLFVITGANQGGKSTFLRSIGVAQMMLQSGMFLPASSFSANLCTNVFTHYRRKEDSSMKSGKLDDELARMSKIIDQIQPGSLMLFNESFAATNENEGSIIAKQIVDALLDTKIKVFFVTHMFEFANACFESYNDNGVFLRAERKTGGKRTFKLTVGEPLPTSFGKDVYKTVFFPQKVHTEPEKTVISEE